MVFTLIAQEEKVAKIFQKHLQSGNITSSTVLAEQHMLQSDKYLLTYFLNDLTQWILFLNIMIPFALIFLSLCISTILFLYLLSSQYY